MGERARSSRCSSVLLAWSSLVSHAANATHTAVPVCASGGHRAGGVGVRVAPLLRAVCWSLRGGQHVRNHWRRVLACGVQQQHLAPRGALPAVRRRAKRNASCSGAASARRPLGILERSGGRIGVRHRCYPVCCPILEARRRAARCSESSAWLRCRMMSGQEVIVVVYASVVSARGV